MVLLVVGGVLGFGALLQGLVPPVTAPVSAVSSSPSQNVPTTRLPPGPPETGTLIPTRCGLARFGSALAADGEHLLVAATARDSSDGVPEACLYERTGDGWHLTDAFRNPESGEFIDFGSSIAMSAGHIAINRPGHENGDGPVSLFAAVDNGFRTLTAAADPVHGGMSETYWDDTVALSAPPSASDDDPGSSGPQLLVGSLLAELGTEPGSSPAGAVFAFDADRATGPLQRLDADAPRGAFGAALAVDGDTLAVGDPSGVRPGRVVLYHRGADGRWASTATLTLTGSADVDGFGGHVALSGGLLVVGATHARPGAGGAGPEGAGGAAEIFREANGSWASIAVLRAADPRPDGWFGSAVATDGTRVLIGEPGGPGRRGRAWRYSVDPDGVHALGPWEPDDLVDGDWFGEAGAMGPGWEAVGAPGITVEGEEDRHGRVYVGP